MKAMLYGFGVGVPASGVTGRLVAADPAEVPIEAQIVRPAWTMPAMSLSSGKAAATSFKTDMASVHLLSFGRLSAANTEP